jgi:ketosteroid isomerase-like protein
MAAAALALVVAGACGGSTQAPPAAPAASTASTPPTPADIRQAALAVLEQYRQAHEVRSVEALDPLYLASPELVRVWQGERTTGWDAVRDQLGALFNRARDIKLRVDQPTVLALGDGGAVVVANAARTVAEGVTSVRVEGVLTLVLRREEQRWRIASEHFSYPPSPH